MKPFIRTTSVLIIALALCTASCARTPTKKTCTGLIQHHFKKYGKKYPKTIFGQSPISNVDITGQQEIHKHLVSVEAFITLQDGSVQRVNATIEKRPLGWRLMSWENATGL